jgi:putative transposase
LRKYGNDIRARAVKIVVLILPGQGIKYDAERRIIRIPCLELEQDAKYFPRFERINQIELSDEYAYVTVTINEPPLGR